MLISIVAFFSLIKKSICLKYCFSYCMVALLYVILPYVCITVVMLFLDWALSGKKNESFFWQNWELWGKVVEENPHLLEVKEV